jgi:hypothetical protein
VVAEDVGDEETLGKGKGETDESTETEDEDEKEKRVSQLYAMIIDLLVEEGRRVGARDCRVGTRGEGEDQGSRNRQKYANTAGINVSSSFFFSFLPSLCCYSRLLHTGYTFRECLASFLPESRSKTHHDHPFDIDSNDNGGQRSRSRSPEHLAYYFNALGFFALC